MVCLPEAGKPFGPQAVGADIVPVVGDIQKQGVFHLPALLHLVQNAPEQLVLVAAEGIEMPDGLLLLLHSQLGKAVFGPPVESRFVEKIVIKIVRQPDFVGVVKIQKPLGHKIGIMGTQRAYKEEIGLLPVQLFQLFHRPVHHILVVEGVFGFAVLEIAGVSRPEDLPRLPGLVALVQVLGLPVVPPFPVVRAAGPGAVLAGVIHPFKAVGLRPLFAAHMPFSAEIQPVSCIPEVLAEHPHSLKGAVGQSVAHVHIVPHPVLGGILSGKKGARLGQQWGEGHQALEKVTAWLRNRYRLGVFTGLSARIVSPRWWSVINTIILGRFC